MSALAVTVVAAGAMIALANSGSAAPGAAVQSSVSSNALTGNWYGAAPYVMPEDNSPPDLTQVMAATGQKSFELAFVNSDGGCSQVCGSASATAAAEQAVINKYSLHAIDLDLEEPEYENTTAINNEVGAAQILQQNNPGLY